MPLQDNEQQETPVDKKAGIYENLFRNPQGEAVLRDLMKRFNFYGTTFDLEAPNELAHAFNEGQRSVVMYILQLLAHNERDTSHLVGDMNSREPWQQEL